jgi:hypothetical protein
MKPEHYYICFDVFYYCYGISSYKILNKVGKREARKKMFKCLVFTQHLRDLGFKTAKNLHTFFNVIYVCCGEKKLRKIIEEAHLLGLEDELLIFKKGDKLNG